MMILPNGEKIEDNNRGYQETARKLFYYIGSAEGHEYPDLQVGDEVNPRTLFVLS